MGRPFKEALEAVYKKQYGNSLRLETIRVHQISARDTCHAFSHVDIPKPGPYKKRTGLTI